jgi:hypothetical protein
MEWSVKVENSTKERLLVRFKPLLGMIEVYGQYKIINEWTDLSVAQCSAEDLSLEELQKTLADALTELKKQIERYEDLQKTFKVIGSISLEADGESKGGGLMM